LDYRAVSATPAFDHRPVLESLPELPGIYRMIDDRGQILYVGKAKSLKKRVSSYFQKTLASPRIALMVRQIAAIETTVTRTETEALLLENNLIKRHLPPFNIVFRDDKSYPYIQLSDAPYPQLSFFRGTPDRKGQHFGPYPSSHSVRGSIGLLQKLFRLRTCTDTVFANRSRACLLYQIRRCSGPCVGHIDGAGYAEDIRLAKLFLGGKAQEVIRQLTTKMEDAASRLEFEQAALYRDQITQFGKLRQRQFVTGTSIDEVDVIVSVVDNGTLCINIAMVRMGEHLGDKPLFPQHSRDWPPAEALSDFMRQHYAAHPVPDRIVCNLEVDDDAVEDVILLANRAVRVTTPRGDEQRSWVEMAENNARLAIATRLASEESRTIALEALRDCLDLDEAPVRIECFDISHTQGEAAVASCVVCVSGAMTPMNYRRFNIAAPAAGDDFASIAQAVRRRYGRAAASSNENLIPDLIVIDGGVGQLNAAREVLRELGIDEALPMIGISKGEGRKEGLEKIVLESPPATIQFPMSHPGFRLLLEVRNEAHRFAVTGHRARRSKVRQESTLDELPGIGPRRRKALLSHFGSLAGVREASVAQLNSVPGISRNVAELVFRTFH
jgi:excinuclease ABC subunit C